MKWFKRKKKPCPHGFRLADVLQSAKDWSDTKCHLCGAMVDLSEDGKIFNKPDQGVT